MSVRAMGLVWERSRAKGSNLLVLLAIADVTDDVGVGFWGSNEFLAVKTRLKERALRYILAKLKRDGELHQRPNAARTRPAGSKGYVPDRFLDVRCVCDWDTYQTEHKGGKVCRRVSTAKIAGIATKSGAVGGKELPELKRKDPLVDPGVEVQAAPLARRESREPEKATYWQLVKLTRLALDDAAFESYAELSAEVKTRTVRLGMSYDQTILDRALSSVTVQLGYDRRIERRAQ